MVRRTRGAASPPRHHRVPALQQPVTGSHRRGEGAADRGRRKRGPSPRQPDPMRNSHSFQLRNQITYHSRILPAAGTVEAQNRPRRMRGMRLSRARGEQAYASTAAFFFFCSTLSSSARLMWGRTPPKAMVARISVSSSSSPRMASWRWRGVMRLTLRSLAAFWRRRGQLPDPRRRRVTRNQSGEHSRLPAREPQR